MAGGDVPKAHKRGRKAGPSAREKHKKTKAAPVHANNKNAAQLGKAGAPGKKAKRMQIAQELKNKRRAETIARKRDAAKGAPRVVAMLSMHASLSAEHVLVNVKNACQSTDRAKTEVFGHGLVPEFTSGSSVQSTAQERNVVTALSPVQGAAMNSSTPNIPPLGGSLCSDTELEKSEYMETVLCTAPKTKLTLLPPVHLESSGGVADWLSVAQIADVLVLCLNAEEMVLKPSKTAGLVRNGAEPCIQDEDNDAVMEHDLSANIGADIGQSEQKDNPSSSEPSVSIGENRNVAPGVAHLLSIWRSLGLSASVAAIVGLEELHPRHRARAKASAQRLLQAYCPGDGGANIRIIDADGSEGSAKLARAIAEAATGSRGPAWRSKRPSLLVESARWTDRPNLRAQETYCTAPKDLTGMELEHQDGLKPAIGGQSANGGFNEGASHLGASASTSTPGALILEGYVRNQALSAAQVLHVPKLGDKRIRYVEVLAQAPKLPSNKAQQHTMDLEENTSIIVAPAEQLHSLDQVNLDNEMHDEEDGGRGMGPSSVCKSRKLFLPKGLADIQAAWLSDEDLQEDVGSKWESGSDDDDGKSGFDAMDDEDNAEGLAAERDKPKSLKEQEKDHLAYPDEIDVERGTVIRERFSKYRGLKSFRSSPWDPREGLPDDYSRIFAFESYLRAKKYALEEMDEITRDPTQHHAVLPGSYVRIIVDELDSTKGAAFVDHVTKPGVSPLICWGLLQHECKISLVHYSLTKFAGYQEPVKSKDHLLFFNGVRFFEACPLLSVDSPSADKYKMERFLPNGQPTMASMYAPITFDPVPVVVLKGGEESAHLVASGSGRGADPDRVVLKRVVLTGFPTKVHRNKATVRHMFYCPEDVKYYKPLELWTKYGRRGRIREPLGTHGLMKCAFDGVIQQKDTICTSLYKRVFPRWPEGFRFA
uniref:Bms1-type G domain-containing protein n=1 Tax=Picocystis salinarum TaxID=88271 RepID=A0A6U9Q6Z5_9CHLO|eukprot:CAMPEP_0183834004 /NCGR_PEP_ID=MMETSP0807_2-20130328/6372_1 /TAXON_ID=88271 /ORGANISM="Picocystis salinarum, Strain CCMP1897" /LENGTH=934 /DNA_ID=CAMNT_0026079987 /DNA_START=144 /DNA_END=2948 /DNA_ORIENTATION=+